MHGWLNSHSEEKIILVRSLLLRVIPTKSINFVIYPRNLKGGSGLFLIPVLTLWDGGHIDCHLGWWVIVPLDLAQSFDPVSLRHDWSRDNQYACVINVHARNATHAERNYLAGLATKKKKKNGDTIRDLYRSLDTIGLSHLHTWRQDGWLSQQISPFLILIHLNFYDFCRKTLIFFNFKFHITRCPQTDYM